MTQSFELLGSSNDTKVALCKSKTGLTQGMLHALVSTSMCGGMETL